MNTKEMISHTRVLEMGVRLYPAHEIGDGFAESWRKYVEFYDLEDSRVMPVQAEVELAFTAGYACGEKNAKTGS